MIYNNDIYTGRTINAHLLTKQWSNTFVTWDKNTPTTNWARRGGDFASTPIGFDTYAQGEVNKWLEFDISDVVKDLHQNQENNFGFILKTENENTGHNIAIRASETSKIEIRPKLVITCEIENQYSPVVKFISPQDGDTLSSSSDNDSVHAQTFDQDIDTLDGSGIASVFFVLLQNSDIIDSITVTESPYIWKDFNSEDYQDGEYTIRATTQSIPSAGGTSAFDEIQVYIHNNITKVNRIPQHNSKPLRVVKKSGEFLLYLPYKTLSSIAITDIHGRKLATFTSFPGKNWYSLPQWIAVGMHMVTIRTEGKIIVKKMLIVR